MRLGESLESVENVADRVVSAEGERTLTRVDVGRALRALNAEDRRLIALRYALDYSHPQIAAELRSPTRPPASDFTALASGLPRSSRNGSDEARGRVQAFEGCLARLVDLRPGSCSLAGNSAYDGGASNSINTSPVLISPS